MLTRIQNINFINYSNKSRNTEKNKTFTSKAVKIEPQIMPLPFVSETAVVGGSEKLFSKLIAGAIYTFNNCGIKTGHGYSFKRISDSEALVRKVVKEGAIVEVSSKGGKLNLKVQESPNSGPVSICLGDGYNAKRGYYTEHPDALISDINNNNPGLNFTDAMALLLKHLPNFNFS